MIISVRHEGDLIHKKWGAGTYSDEEAGGGGLQMGSVLRSFKGCEGDSSRRHRYVSLLATTSHYKQRLLLALYALLPKAHTLPSPRAPEPGSWETGLQTEGGACNAWKVTVCTTLRGGGWIALVLEVYNAVASWRSDSNASVGCRRVLHFCQHSAP